MKKMLLPFLGILLLAGCEKEAATPIDGETDTALDFRSQEDKVYVCHYSEEDDSWHVINVSQNALAAHQAHGDAVDMDGDGFFDKENGCSDVDCDGDTEYNPDNSCGACVEGELKVTLDDGTIRYVHPEDQATGAPFSVGVNWSNAQAACANLAEETGCNWYLPTLEELGAIHQQLFVDQGGIWHFDASQVDGGIRLSGDTGFNSWYYWSSEGSAGSAWYLYFAGGIPYNFPKSVTGVGCRCVRR